jgi:RHS repeat-associated protein
LASLDYARGTTDLLNLTYNYNQTYNGNTVNNGQIQGVTDARGNAFSTSYTYDQLGRLLLGKTLDLTAANTWELGWIYDRYGNRTQQNLLGGTISTTTPQLTIDPATNHITNAGYSYDANNVGGNLAADGTGASYTYDAENRMKTFTNGTTSATYSYDGKGLRVKKQVGTNSTVYVFSGSKPIAEYTNGNLSVKYVYAGSQLLATLYQSTATPVVYHYPDHLSARFETNPNGTVTRTSGHLPFGETWYETGSSVKQKFTSYERDSESGLDYAVFRYDSSRLGRFMTPDLLAGITAIPQSLSLYSYAVNDPVNLADPLGLCGFELHGWPDEGIIWFEGDPCGGHPAPVLDVPELPNGRGGRRTSGPGRPRDALTCQAFVQSLIDAINRVQNGNGILPSTSLGTAMVGFALANPLVRTTPVGFRPELTAYGQGSGVYRHIYWMGGFGMLPGGSVFQNGLGAYDFWQLAGSLLSGKPRMESLTELKDDVVGEKVGKLLDDAFAGKISEASLKSQLEQLLCVK